jgi:predicted O-methyltransferase YrrM
MWYRLWSYIRFYWKASTRYNVQSSFLHDFVEHILDSDRVHYPYPTLEEARLQLIQDDRMIQVVDYGAGSLVDRSHQRSISSIAQAALSSPSQSKVLFCLMDHYRCQSALELGTCLGLSSAYLSWASLDARVVTIEGDPQIADAARALHHRLGLKNVEVITGTFQQVLPDLLRTQPHWDLVYIDGHHIEEATISYFEQILPHCHDKTIFIFDDIYWSSGMERAWQRLIAHGRTTLCIDLYDMGIVFINPQLSAESIALIDYKYKPWRIGLFGK